MFVEYITAHWKGLVRHVLIVTDLLCTLWNQTSVLFFSGKRRSVCIYGRETETNIPKTTEKTLSIVLIALFKHSRSDIQTLHDTHTHTQD